MVQDMCFIYILIVHNIYNIHFFIIIFKITFHLSSVLCIVCSIDGHILFGFPLNKVEI